MTVTEITLIKRVMIGFRNHYRCHFTGDLNLVNTVKVSQRIALPEEINSILGTT